MRDRRLTRRALGAICLGGVVAAGAGCDGRAILDPVVGTEAFATLADQPEWIAAAAAESAAVAWGDWDGDGDLDLAVARRDGPNIVYENDGGTLQHDPVAGLGWTSPDDTPTWDVAWGDWDGDGDLDLAAGNEAAADVVYRNDGGGAMPVDWTAPDADSTSAVAWGDGDGDGDLDLAVASQDGPNRVYENTGGALVPDWEASGPVVQTSDIAWGDWDGDGDLDLAVAIFDEPPRLYANVAGVLALLPTWEATPTSSGTSLAWGDVDGDGFLDLAVGSSGAADSLWTSEGAPPWLPLAPTWSSDDSSSTSSLAWGDGDGDGDLDLVAGSTQPSDPDRLYLNAGGSLDTTALQWSADVLGQTADVAWGDMDGDRALDLAMAKLSGPLDQPLVDRVFLNNGIGLATSDWVPNAEFSHDIEWGDLDGDGDLDLAVINGGTNVVYENEDGALNAAPSWWLADSDTSRGGAWGDWDGDGDLDLAVANIDSISAGTPTANQVYENVDGVLDTTPAWLSPETDESRGLAWGDVDGDGDLDLAVANQEGEPVRLYVNGGGSLALSWSAPDADIDSRDVEWGDWDGDGDLDLAVANRHSPNRVYVNDGGALADVAAWSSVASNRSYAASWGDWDGDGDLDLAVGNGSSDSPEENVVYENLGGTLAPTPAWTALLADSTADVAWGDWDGDGDLDLAVANGSGQPNHVYDNDGSGLADAPAWTSPEAEDSGALAWADFDGDGDLDLAVANSDGEPNRLYVNHRIGPADLPENPTRVSIHFVVAGDPTPVGFSRAAVLLGPTIGLELVLADPESDPVRSSAITFEFSVMGGGSWQEAEVLGMPSELEASPGGQVHAVSWDISSTPVSSDSVRVRVRIAHQAPRHVGGPLLNGAVTASSAVARVYSDCFPVDADGDGSPCAGGIDCDETDPAVHPGAKEECDAVDQDCDGDLVEGFADLDEDAIPDCADPDADGDGHLAEPAGDDCNDGDPAAYPGAPELCDGVDQDCDGLSTGEADLDGDGAWPCDGDCDDDDPLRGPGFEEVCDGVDNDCDEAAPNELDADGDGVLACADDCDDADPTVYPGADELCEAGAVDHDCDGEEADLQPKCWDEGCDCSSAGSSPAGPNGLALLLLGPLLGRRRRRSGRSRPLSRSCRPDRPAPPRPRGMLYWTGGAAPVA